MQLRAEGQDYVVCCECGHQGAKLYRHVESAHGLSSTAYLERHPGAPLRCSATKAKQSATRAARFDAAPKTWRETKEVACPSCSKAHLVGKSMGSLHDLRCPKCKEEARDSLWAGKVEGVDFLRCLECSHRAENLTSHITQAHPGYRERHPSAVMVTDGSAVRDKTLLKGRVLSDDTRTLMSANAGRWNAGLTKETDSRVAAHASKMRGKVSWCRGLTKETDSRVRAVSESMREWALTHPEHGTKHAAALTLDDFTPYLEADGTVDRRAAEQGLLLTWKTLYTYMKQLGLSTSNKYAKARSERVAIRITKAELERFKLRNGRVGVGMAMRGLQKSYFVVARECRRHGLETHNQRIQQTLCLEAVAKALGGASFVQEWQKRSFVNPKTNYMFKFDGYYADWNLIVEYQHYTFPNAYMRDESYRYLWEEARWRDEEKVRLATAAGIRYLVVLDSEPFADPMYLAGRLVQMGVLEPAAVGGA